MLVISFIAIICRVNIISTKFVPPLNSTFLATNSCFLSIFAIASPLGSDEFICSFAISVRLLFLLIRLMGDLMRDMVFSLMMGMVFSSSNNRISLMIALCALCCSRLSGNARSPVAIGLVMSSLNFNVMNFAF